MVKPDWIRKNSLRLVSGQAFFMVKKGAFKFYAGEDKNASPTNFCRAKECLRLSGATMCNSVNRDLYCVAILKNNNRLPLQESTKAPLQ